MSLPCRSANETFEKSDLLGLRKKNRSPYIQYASQFFFLQPGGSHLFSEVSKSNTFTYETDH